MEVNPFKALYFNQRLLSIEKVMADPSDIIKIEKQKQLYKKSPFNVVRLLLGNKETAYPRQLLEEWVEKKILLEASDPNFYLYQHCFKRNGILQRLIGIYASIPLSKKNQRKIFLHEKILKAPFKNRLKRFSECNCQLSPIYAIYKDEENKLDLVFKKMVQTKPFMYLKDKSLSGEYSVWKITGKSNHRAIKNFFADKNIYIADGHHRYQSLLNLNKINRCNNAMFFISNATQESVEIDPIHRAFIKLKPTQLESVEKKLKSYFLMTSCIDVDHLKKQVSIKKGNIGWIDKENGYQCLELKEGLDSIDEKTIESIKKFKNCSVVIFHKIIVELILKMNDSEIEMQKNILYYCHDQVLNNDIKLAKVQTGFILNSICMDSLMQIAKNSYQLPQKSTFFYPKILNGIFLKKFKN